MANAKRIDGKAMAARLADEIRKDTQSLKDEFGVTPGLAVVIVGEDPASQVYVRNKKRTALELGFHSVQHEVPADIEEEALLQLINGLNNDDEVHGILVQLPLPAHLNEDRITQSVSATKDVDGFHYINIGKLSAGASDTGFVPCTPAGCLMMIQEALGDDLSGKNAVVIGRSNIVGKPMASLLVAANATVTIAHSRTRDLESLCRTADILVAAVGRPEMVTGDWIKEGAVVIDVGINRVERNGKTGLVGDVDYASAEKVASAITPVPGGVGPMTIMMLMSNTLKAAKAGQR